MVSPFLCTLALFCLISCGPLNSGPLGKLWNSQNINWLISLVHTDQPMNLAGKRQYEELISWSSRPSTKYIFPYRTQFQFLGPHRPASWANRQTGPPFSVSVSLGRHLQEQYTPVHQRQMVIEAKRSESFANYVFFDIEAKRTRSIVGKFILKRSEHVYIKQFKKRSEANTFDSLNIYFEAKRTCLY